MPSFILPQAISNLFWSESLSPEQLNRHADELAAFFPLLYYRKRHFNHKAIDQLKEHYLVDDDATVDEVDERVLNELILDCLRQHTRKGLRYLNLDAVNRVFAENLAKHILNAHQADSDQDLDSWFDEYEDNLRLHIMEQLPLINGQHWTYKETYSEKMDSLSFLWNNRALTQASELMSKIADAHAFIQATNSSPQYENSILAVLDIYNYKRSYKQISEIKSIVYSLFKPFHTIYFEYKDIAFYETNGLKKLFRVLMPLVIIVATIIMTAILLNPFTLPELAFAAAFVPAFLLGVALASQYIWLKNNIYNSVREFFYGGHYEIPEFQINKRMILTFKTRLAAAQVREFYINELNQCEALEQKYQQNENWLTSNEQMLRKNNSQRRDTLCLEWYDIHSSKMAIDKVPEIVLAQLAKTTLKETKQLESELKTAQSEITASVSQLCDTLKSTLNHCTPYTTREAKKIPIEFSHRLFRPEKCLIHKSNAEKMDRLSQLLLPQPV